MNADWSKRSIFNRLYQALTAAVLMGIIIGTVLSLAVHHLYHHDFPELNFWHLLIFAVGHMGSRLIVLALILALASFLFHKWLNIILKNIKTGAFFFASMVSLLFTFWVGFYTHANILRYSRDHKSTLMNTVVILLGVILFFAVYKLIPRKLSQGKQKINQWFALLLTPVLILLTWIPNPFSLERYVGDPPRVPPRLYDAVGGFIGSQEYKTSSDLNVILFSIDTLRADGLGCYGNPKFPSPNIDALAERGLVFKSVLAQSSWTLPSHMTMITSLYPSVHGCITSPVWTDSHEMLADHWITLAEVLQGWGYRTGAFTDGMLLGPVYNFDQGFDICDDSGGGIKKIAPRADAWIRSLNDDKPFFLFLHCYDVHRYNPPPELIERFCGSYQGKLKKLKPAHRLEDRIVSNGFYTLSQDDVNYLKGLYNAKIFSVDREFGNLVKSLKAMNLLDNTMIVVTSDHGEEFWEHRGTGHGWSLHQHQLMVPLIVTAPGRFSPSRSIGEWVGVIDIAPTILDILGMPLPRQFQGISLLPLISGGEYGPRDFYAEASHLTNQKCIISGGFSFLYNRYPPIGENLSHWGRFKYVWRGIMNYTDDLCFNLIDDPGETRDILSRTPERDERLKSRLLQWISHNLSIQYINGQIKRGRFSEETRKHLESLGYIQ